MRTKNVQHELDLSDLWAVPESLVKRTNQFLQAGDVLVSSANSWNLVGKCCWVPELPWRTSFGGFVSVLRSDRRRIEPRFLFRWFASDPIQAVLRSFGQKTTSISNLNIARCRELSLPLPTLPEQRRIADILDRAEALRVKRRAALEQLDTLTQSLFLDLFGDPGKNVNGWEIATISEAAECLDRLRKPVKASERTEGRIPYYGANGQQGWIDKALFNEPLVLVAEDGGHFDHPERGVAYRIDGPAWVNNHAHVLRARSERVDVEYLHRALRHYDFTPYISGTTRAKLTQGQMADASLILPPLALQQEFAHRIDAVENVRTTHRASLAELDALFRTLQHHAFRGEL